MGLARVARPFPDREQRHLLQFYVLPSWPYGKRIALAAGLILLGLIIQMLWQPDSYIPLLIVTLPIIFTGELFLLIRGFDSKPTDNIVGGNWEKTTLDRFEEVKKLQDRTKSWDETLVDWSCTTGFLSLVGLAIGVFLIAAFLGMSSATRYWVPVFIGDAIIMICPLWMTGTRRGWKPATLREQIESIEVVMKELNKYPQPSCQLQPMLEMAGKDDSRVPSAARLFVRFPDGPEDFYGVQFQVSLNDVQGTKYPYLYAVLVAKSQFGLLDKYLDLIRSDQPSKVVVETDRETDVDVIVIRQETSKTSGYHTKPTAIRKITTFAWESCAGIIGAASE